MKTLRSYAFVLPALISVTIILAMTYGGFSQASTSVPVDDQLIPSLAGKDLFRTYCASCHGTDARGHGPVAPELKSKVPDLTKITSRNRGVFPWERVRNTIDGEQRPFVHGTREMPVWGPFFSRVEADADFGKVRVDNLVRYLESLQETAPAKMH